MYQLKDGEEGNNILKSKRFVANKQTTKKKTVSSTASLRKKLTRGLFSGD